MACSVPCARPASCQRRVRRRIDAYLEEAPEFARPLLRELRERVHGACPRRRRDGQGGPLAAPPVRQQLASSAGSPESPPSTISIAAQNARRSLPQEGPARYAMRMKHVLVVAWSCIAAASSAAQAPAGPAVPASPAPSTVVAASDVPVGKAEFKVQSGPVELQVFTYRPANWSGARLLLVMHGVLRNADEYRDHAIGMGDRFDALVVAPKFDAERFPSRAYQRGGILREDGTAAPVAEWTYSRLPELAAAMRTRTGKPAAKLYVIGHSAGGQFLVRCAAFADIGAERIVAANPGSVLLPTRDVPFGYGLGGLPAELTDEARLRAYLAAPLTLFLGTGDDHADEHFDRSQEAMTQGTGRHQRGLALWWTAKNLAASRGWPFGWRLVEAVGIGHDHEQMFAHAKCEVALFGDAAAKTPAVK
jgi:dienelactone hydrolase